MSSQKQTSKLDRSQAPKKGQKHILLAFFLNLFFTIIELIGGFWTNSLAILSDAVHDLGDTIGLGTSWYLEKISHKNANRKFTYGYRRFSVLGALFNSLIIVVGSALILRESIPRILEPELAHANGMIIMSILGIVFNGFAAYVAHDKTSLNHSVVSLHLMEDLLGWVVVLVGSVTMKFTGWLWVDPIMSAGISIYIGYNAIKNLRKGLRIILQGTPSDEDYEKHKQTILDTDDVLGVHDLRIWTLDGEKSVLSAHVIVDDDMSFDKAEELKLQIHSKLQESGIAYCTIEFEKKKNCSSKHLKDKA